MTGAVATHLQKIGSKHPFHTAMLIPMMGFVCAWVYPVYVNIWNKETMDVHRATDVGIVPGPSEKELELAQSRSHGDKQNVGTVEEANV
jgi:FHS family L-fucose permease-like MFS transporter